MSLWWLLLIVPASLFVLVCALIGAWVAWSYMHATWEL